MHAPPTLPTGLNNKANPVIAPHERKQITWPSRFEKKTDNRIRVVMERVDITTGKKARSFQRQDGTIKFIEWPCDLCERIGKKGQWHFSFKCPTRDKMTAMISETIDSDFEAEADSENELPGVSRTQYTQEPTSYTFASSASKRTDHVFSFGTSGKKSKGVCARGSKTPTNNLSSQQRNSPSWIDGKKKQEQTS